MVVNNCHPTSVNMWFVPQLSLVCACSKTTVTVLHFRMSFSSWCTSRTKKNIQRQ
uniref:Uncharacterized protein n=1 Tax=Lepeophtheirus salmonis TaxID=72036 RepID=A0A0K2TLM0_LEPSM